MIVYKDIIGKLKEAGYTTYTIKRDRILSEGTMQSLRDGKAVSLTTIDIICGLLKCKIEDIVEIKNGTT